MASQVDLETRLAASDESHDKALIDEMTAFAARLYRSPVPLVVTSTEMGLGGLPQLRGGPAALARGEHANQILAQQAAAWC